MERRAEDCFVFEGFAEYNPKFSKNVKPKTAIARSIGTARTRTAKEKRQLPGPQRHSFGIGWNTPIIELAKGIYQHNDKPC